MTKRQRDWLLSSLALFSGGLLIGLMVDREMMHGPKYRAVSGLSIDAAIAELGPPALRMQPSDFFSVRLHRCEPSKVQGEVLFYEEKLAGWYLYFDQRGVLVETDGSLHD